MRGRGYGRDDVGKMVACEVEAAAGMMLGRGWRAR